MNTIAECLTAEHRACDGLLEPAEGHARARRWDAAAACLHDFGAALEDHLAREEQVLFPALEAAAGARFDPTQVMRAEHESMRELLARLREAVAMRDVDAFVDTIDTLSILIGQHNIKEENVLYPMAARLLPDPQQVVEAMNACERKATA